MSYQIDYINVGDGEKSGDAIGLRYGNFNGSVNDQSVAIIDGGTKESGKELVNTVKSHYGTDIVDYVISTHQDADHAAGLKTIILPAENRKDLDEVPKKVRDEIKFYFVSRVDEALRIAFTKPLPSPTIEENPISYLASSTAS